MAKAAKIEFVCTECGMNYQRWQGQCRCGAWNTLAEFKPSAGQAKLKKQQRVVLLAVMLEVWAVARKKLMTSQPLKPKSSSPALVSLIVFYRAVLPQAL
ncbi:hypothetical protein KAN5_02030 [Pseudoalteromonas sp. KAN5]|nr:hypothetical protein KAN5_02030 [Pseudoalteromonas sp. KAN5]